MNRMNMAIMTWLGIVIVVGLILSHSPGVNQVMDSGFKGISDILNTLEHPGAKENPTGH